MNELPPRLERIPFVLMAAMSDRGYELRALQLGADDYITKPIDFDILETIINARLAGVARNQIADAGRHEISPKLTNLNDREAEILTWVARGKTSAQIAEMLDITKRTVDFHPVSYTHLDVYKRQGRRWPEAAISPTPVRCPFH